MSEDIKFITLTCTDGSTLQVLEEYEGRHTGYGRVVNGYLEGIEYFDKISDGDTVIEVPFGTPGALPIADAYQMLFDSWDDERTRWNEYYRSIGETEYPVERRVTPPVYGGVQDQVLTHTPFANLQKMIVVRTS